jgi:hypothetical protein
MNSKITIKKGLTMKLHHALTPILRYAHTPILLLFASLSGIAPWATTDAFAGALLSETLVVSNSASSTNVINTYPQLAGANCAWHPITILANLRDSPTGTVLQVDYVRAGIVNRHVSTNATIAITNNLCVSNTAAATASVIWHAPAKYEVFPTNDWLRITTSSTNAEIIIFKEVE